MKKIIVIFFIQIAANIAFSQDKAVFITDFYQGLVTVSVEFQKCNENKKLGNCATIALIKASLAEFGDVGNIFKKYSTTGDSISCTFNDGISVSIKENDRDVVKKLSGIKKPDNSKYYETAITIYALICKRLVFAKIGCVLNFENAVEYLNSGYSTPNVPELLALKSISVRIKDLKNYPSVIIYTSAHAAFCTNGYQDFLGESHKIKLNWMKNPIGIGGKISGAFRLTK